MNARLWGRLLLALMSVLISACGGLQPRRVLIVWHALSGPQERALLNLVDRWNRANPAGAFIVPEHHPQDALHRAMLAGPRPALALVEPAQAALYTQHDLLATLNSFTDSDDPEVGWQTAERADLFPFVFQAGAGPDGRLIGVPFGGDVGLVLANRALLQEASMPETWEDFDRLCSTVANPLAGVFCFGFDLNDPRTLADWVHARGASLHDPLTQQPTFTAPRVSAAIESLADYLDVGQAYRVSSAARSQDDFAAGRAVFLLANSRDLPTIQELVSKGEDFALDLGPLPAPTERPAALLSAPLWVIPKGAPRDERAAWLFVRWLLEADQTAAWAVQTNALPARASALAEIASNAQQPADALRVKLISKIAPRAQAVPLLAGWPCVQNALTSAARKVIELGQPTADALASAQTEAQRLAEEPCEQEG